MKRKKIAVDLDGTWATYTGWKGANHIGEPVAEVTRRIAAALVRDFDIVVFTARVANDSRAVVVAPIRFWVIQALRAAGVALEVIEQRVTISAVKTMDITEIWDDRAVGIAKNQGAPADIRDSLWYSLR